MLEESTPFVIVDHKDSVGPVWACGHRAVDKVEERFSIANIGVWVIIAGSAALLVNKTRVYERYLRQGSRCTILQKLAKKRLMDRYFAPHSARMGTSLK